ncbi:MAG: hypothetical protein FWE05_08925 [Defluviitaleaceae bacterium]|nr:hypothetical protein [Defluviitaleaceae bacterium]
MKDILKMSAVIFALALMLVFALSACGNNGNDTTNNQAEAVSTPEPSPEATPAPPEETDEPEEVEEDAFIEIPDVFLWNNFVGRDPHNMPGVSPNGAPMWWDNWANLRASVENDVVQIQFRPNAFDPEDFDDYDDYFTRVNDWMGNWGEAIDMWSLDGISFMRYMTIRMAGGEGGEEYRLILHFVPDDGPSFVARFADLVLADGSNPSITTEMQDIVIDLEASGFPGMTNRMHIRAFADATIFLDEIYFSVPVSQVDTTSRETILGGITVPEIGNPADLPIRAFVEQLGE